MRCFAALLIIFLGGILLNASAQDGGRPAKLPSTTVDGYAAEKYFDFHASGSIALGGTCKDSLPGINIVTERLSTRPAGPFKNLDEALDALTQLDNRYSWTRQSDSFVKLRDNHVTAPLLSFRLNLFKSRSRIDSDEMIRELMSIPEVVSFMKSNGIAFEIAFTGASFHHHSEGSSSQSITLRNVTIEEALDRIVLLYPGVWIYNECSREAGKAITIRIDETR